MVTVDPPARFGVLTMPRLDEVWRAVQMHPPVAITAIVCATIAFCWLVWSLTQASDAMVISLATGGVLAAAAGAWVKVRKGKNGT